MFCVWTISAYYSKHCTGRCQDIREDQGDQERTGGAQATKTYKRWGSPGKKQRWQLLTDTDGVGVWPNVSSWMRDEPRSKVQQPKAVALWVKKVPQRGQKLQLSDRQYCDEELLILNVLKMEGSSPKFCIFKQKFSDKKEYFPIIFSKTQNLEWTFPSAHLHQKQSLYAA